jgi:low temperature requirement protein LtrA
MLIGAVDPLEGSLLILPGIGLAAVGAKLRRSRHLRLMTWALGLAVFGIAAMFVISSFGGLRMKAGQPGLSAWWGLLMLPYPAGWIAAVVGSVLGFREGRRRAG